MLPAQPSAGAYVVVQESMKSYVKGGITVTANQINFFKAKEEAKHWRRTDKEGKRHNTSTESIQSESNRIQEWWNQQNAAHLVRSDAINMAHYERMDSENRRHNVESEILSGQSNLIKYDEYLLNKDVKQHEVAIKEEQLQLDKALNISNINAKDASARYDSERAKTEKSKRTELEASAYEKQQKGNLNAVHEATDVVDSINKTLETVRRYIPIIGLLP